MQLHHEVKNHLKIEADGKKCFVWKYIPWNEQLRIENRKLEKFMIY